jgi:hypothetical protein
VGSVAVVSLKQEEEGSCSFIAIMLEVVEAVAVDGGCCCRDQSGNLLGS